MKKIILFFMLFLLGFKSFSETPLAVIASDGCIGIDREGNEYIKLVYSSSIHTTYGSHVAIWISTGSGYLGYLLPSSIT